MKQLKRVCLDCGSPALTVTVDDLLPRFKMEVVSYACGAELRSIYSSNGTTGRLCLAGCGMIEEQVAPV